MLNNISRKPNRAVNGSSMYRWRFVYVCERRDNPDWISSSSWRNSRSSGTEAADRTRISDADRGGRVGVDLVTVVAVMHTVRLSLRIPRPNRRDICKRDHCVSEIVSQFTFIRGAWLLLRSPFHFKVDVRLAESENPYRRRINDTTVWFGWWSRDTLSSILLDMSNMYEAIWLRMVISKLKNRTDSSLLLCIQDSFLINSDVKHFVVFSGKRPIHMNMHLSDVT